MTSPAARSSDARASSPVKSAAHSWPSATRTAPVRVAKSRMTSARNLSAYVSASARTSRPSASVLSTSTVLPLRNRRMSPGRVAEPLGRFSVVGVRAITRTGSFSAFAARTHASTVAAPIMSYFISPIEAEGLIEIPPESNVIPFPTRTAVPRGAAGRYSAITNAGGRTLPALTASRPAIFSRSISRLPRTRTFRRSLRPAWTAARASSAGPRSFPGVFPRSLAHDTASATTAACRAAAASDAASTSSGGTTTAVVCPPVRTFFGADL